MHTHNGELWIYFIFCKHKCIAKCTGGHGSAMNANGLAMNDYDMTVSDMAMKASGFHLLLMA